MNMNMNMNGSSAIAAALLLFLGGPEESHAQTTSPDRCGAGDDACYLRQYESACATRSEFWVSSCTTLVVAIESGPNRDDRAARRTLALAHLMLATRQGVETAEVARQRAEALTEFRNLVEEDPSDLDALHGLVAITADAGERLELLRRIVKLEPNPISVRSLTNILSKSGRPEDLIEAADANDLLYESGGGTKLEIAGRVIDLHRRAGSLVKADAVSQRVHQDFNIDGLLERLSQVPLADPNGTISALQTLCHPSMIRSVDAKYCIRGVEAVFEALPQRGGQESIQRVVDIAVGSIPQLSSDAESALASVDPDWRIRFTRLLDSLITREFASVAVYGVRSYLEPQAAVRARLMERALLLSPDHPGLLEELAFEYQALGRWNESIELMRRARNLPTTTVEGRQRIDFNIRGVEEHRDRSR